MSRMNDHYAHIANIQQADAAVSNAVLGIVGASLVDRYLPNE
jgi:hypothetical protein